MMYISQAQTCKRAAAKNLCVTSACDRCNTNSLHITVPLQNTAAQRLKANFCKLLTQTHIIIKQKKCMILQVNKKLIQWKLINVDIDDAEIHYRSQGYCLNIWV